jgi:hypothetical protein
LFFGISESKKPKKREKKTKKKLKRKINENEHTADKAAAERLSTRA